MSLQENSETTAPFLFKESVGPFIDTLPSDAQEETFTPLKIKNQKRDFSIDIIRGFSLFLMLAANMTPYFEGDFHILYRYSTSFIAPVFIVIATMMVQLSVQLSRQNFYYFLKRGLFIIAVGAFIDFFIHQELPLTVIDILSFMGMAIPLVYLIAKFNFSIKTLSLFMGMIILATPFLQQSFNYQVEHPTLAIHFQSLFPFFNVENLSSVTLNLVVKRWMVDGDFPFFPWFAYALFGIILGKIRFNNRQSMVERPFLFTAFGMAIVGQIIFSFYPGPIHLRNGFSELFYPATTGLIIMTLGITLLHFSLIDFLQKFKIPSQILSLFSVYGEASLFVYFAHELIIFILIASVLKSLNLEKMNLLIFCVVTLAHALTLFVLCLYLRKIKSSWKKMPTMARWFFGS